MKKKPLLARWTTNWDCGYETNWWYVIKDTPFDINSLKSKRRYEISKGNKNFEVIEIDPSMYAEQIYEVAKAAYQTYPEAYRPNIERDTFISEVKEWNFYKTYGAFSVKSGKLCGYALLKKDGLYIDFCVLKAIPGCEKLGLNAAIVYKILTDHNDFIECGGYICDGSRSIQHMTAFQDYLEKYFQFRKAYCKLHIEYSPNINCVVKACYPFRKILKKLGAIKIIGQINAIMAMEELVRQERR